MSKLLTFDEALEKFRVAAPTLRGWMSRRMVPFLKINGVCRFDEVELQAFIEQCRVPSGNQEKGSRT